MHTEVLVHGQRYLDHTTCSEVSDECDTSQRTRRVDLEAVDDVLVSRDKDTQDREAEWDRSRKRGPGRN